MIQPTATNNTDKIINFLGSLLDLAKRRSLYCIEVLSPTDRASDIKAFQNLGFEQVCIYTDYWMLPDGELRDVSHLILRLRSTADEY